MGGRSPVCGGGGADAKPANLDVVYGHAGTFEDLKCKPIAANAKQFVEAVKGTRPK